MEMEIITGVFVMLLLVLLAFAIHSSYERAKAKEKKDEASAAWNETKERIFSLLMCSVLIGYALVCNQCIVTYGFSKLFGYLEVLVRG